MSTGRHPGPRSPAAAVQLGPSTSAAISRYSGHASTVVTSSRNASWPPPGRAGRPPAGRKRLVAPAAASNHAGGASTTVQREGARRRLDRRAHGQAPGRWPARNNCVDARLGSRHVRDRSAAVTKRPGAVAASNTASEPGGATETRELRTARAARSESAQRSRQGSARSRPASTAQRPAGHERDRPSGDEQPPPADADARRADRLRGAGSCGDGAEPDTNAPLRASAAARGRQVPRLAAPRGGAGMNFSAARCRGGAAPRWRSP